MPVRWLRVATGVPVTIFGLCVRTLRIAMLIPFFYLMGSARSEDAEHHTLCLYGMVVGGKAIKPAVCNDDPIGLMDDSDIQALLGAFNIPPSELGFEGCEAGKFSTKQVGERFLIQYPLGDEISYIAPIAHELAHVWQSRNAGSMAMLMAENLASIKQIELGADFLTGIVFKESEAFTKNMFQTSLSLSGRYVEKDAEAHGTPAQRISAFRYGYFAPPFENLRDANEEFQANIYGKLQHP